jgi:dihydrodipicolinate reductase
MVESTLTRKVRIAILGGTGAVGREILRHAKSDDRIELITIVSRNVLDEWKQDDYKPKL